VNPDNWRGSESPATTTKRAVRSTSNGLMDGRVAEARPVPPRRRINQEPDEPSDSLVYIGDTAPDVAPHGKLWFDTSS
jgi:hypothetical protein